MTDDLLSTLKFSRGGAAAIKADEELSAARKGNFRKVEYLENPGKGNHVILRYLTEEADWLYANVHAGLPTKNQPSDWPADAKWPSIITPVCRYNDVFKKSRIEQGLEPVYSDCYPCDTQMQNNYGRVSRPAVRVWALACVREEVIGTPELIAKYNLDPAMVGKRVGFKDAVRKVVKVDSEGKPTDEFTLEPRIVVVNKPLGYYFTGLQAIAGVYGSICDQDYLVKQTDEKKDIEFHHMPLGPDGMNPSTPEWAQYTKAIEEQKLDLEQLILKNSTDDFYGLFIDPNKAQPPREKKDDAQSQSGAPASQQASAPSNEPDPAAVAAMRDRIRGLTGAEPGGGGNINFSNSV